MVTASQIATTLKVGIDDLIPAELITAEANRRIVSVIGKSAYDAIEAANGSGEDYEVPGGYMDTALTYFVGAEMVGVIANRPDQRGVFKLNAETAQQAMPDGLDSLTAYYRDMANTHLQILLDWIKENETTWTIPELKFGDRVSFTKSTRSYAL